MWWPPSDVDDDDEDDMCVCIYSNGGGINDHFNQVSWLLLYPKHLFKLRKTFPFHALSCPPFFLVYDCFVCLWHLPHRNSWFGFKFNLTLLKFYTDVKHWQTNKTTLDDIIIHNFRGLRFHPIPTRTHEYILTLIHFIWQSFFFMLLITLSGNIDATRDNKYVAIATKHIKHKHRRQTKIFSSISFIFFVTFRTVWLVPPLLSLLCSSHCLFLSPSLFLSQTYTVIERRLLLSHKLICPPKKRRIVNQNFFNSLIIYMDSFRIDQKLFRSFEYMFIICICIYMLRPRFRGARH